MDMAVANLLKRKIKFLYIGEVTHYGEKERHYMSMPIENKWSIGARYVHELCLKTLRPFITHIISTIVTEESEPINYISVRVEVWDLSTGHRNGGYFDDRQDLMRIYVRDPESRLEQTILNSQPSIFPFIEEVIKHPFGISVKFLISHLSPLYQITNPMEDDEDEEDQVHNSYRQDCCVICLEAKPNILYLDCKHIAICDSCDRLKKTDRKNCDVCRGEISKRVKI